MNRKITLTDAINADAYEWLNANAAMYLEAIENELAAGATPEMIRNTIMRNVGPDRAGLALRCEQAARYLMGTI